VKPDKHARVTDVPDLVAGLRHEVESRLRRQAASYYPERVEHGAPEIVCTRTIDRGFSLRFEFTLNWADSPATKVIAKIRRDSVNDAFDQLQQTATAAALGRAEFEGLARAYRYFSANHAGLGVVRPLDYDEERNVLIVEHASGRDLGVLVAARDPGCVKAFARCGRWLRLFHHDLHSSRLRTWSPSEVHELMNKRGRPLIDRGVPLRVLDPLLASLEKLAATMQSQPVRWSTLHGDYKLKHVWATPDGVQALDFGNTHEGDCCRDVAAFLVEILLLRLGNPLADVRRVTSYADAFLEEYFQGPIDPVLPVYVIECLLKKWHRRLGAWSGGKSNPMYVRFQRSLSLMGTGGLLNRTIVDRWFVARLQEWMERASVA
jgi:hypothetical protein